MLSQATASASAAQKRALYRSIVREIRLNVVKPVSPSERRASPISSFVRSSFASAPAPAPAGPSDPTAPQQPKETDEVLAQRRLVEAENLHLFLRSKRLHKDLLARYNSTFGMTEEERVKATARRVGLDVPVEYMGEGSQGGAAPAS